MLNDSKNSNVSYFFLQYAMKNKREKANEKLFILLVHAKIRKIDLNESSGFLRYVAIELNDMSETETKEGEKKYSLYERSQTQE